MDRREFLRGGMTAAATAAALGALAPQAAFAAKPASVAARTASVGPEGIFDVKTYGAKGDGVTDDTSAIQSAIAGAASASGGVVWLPAGSYLVSTLTLPGPVVLEGTGWQSVLKLKGGTNAPAITTPVGQTSYYGAIRNLAVSGNKAANSSAAHGIQLWGADHYRIEGVRVTDCSGSAIKGEGDSQHYSIAPYIAECYLDSCSGSGLDLNSFTYDVKAHHVDIGLCDKGVVIPGSSFLSDISAWGCNVGFYGYWASRAHLMNCRAERSRYHGFWLDGCTDLVLDACRAYENNQCREQYDGFRVTGSSGHASQRVSLVGCHAGLEGSAHEAQRYGFSDGGSAHADYVLCTGCVAMGNLTAGYGLEAGANNVVGHNL